MPTSKKIKKVKGYASVIMVEGSPLLLAYAGFQYQFPIFPTKKSAQKFKNRIQSTSHTFKVLPVEITYKLK